MNRHFTFLYLVLALAARMSAQVAAPGCTASLSGKVLDDHDRTPLGFATVYIVELDRAVMSDEAGNYRFDNLCDGIYTVKVSHVACELVEAKVRVNKQTIQHYYPEHHTELLKDIEISASRLQPEPIQPEQSVTPEKMEQTRGQPLAEMLKNVTGVTSLNTGNSISKPVIHGMHSNRVLLLNNGVRQEGQQWGAEHAPEVDPFIAGKLTVVKGANSVRYGSDAIAGVILVEPRPLRESAGTAGALNLVGESNGRGGSASAFLEGNLKKLSALSWRVQGTFRQLGTLAAPDYNLVNTGSKEHNFSYALQWKKPGYGADIFYSQFNTRLGIFGASHIGNLTDLRRAFQSPQPLETGPFTYDIAPPYQLVEHELLRARSFMNTGRRGRLLITYARQYNLRNEFDKHKHAQEPSGENEPDLHFELTTHSADLVWENTGPGKLRTAAGVSGLTQGNTHQGRALIPNYRSNTAGAFATVRLRLNRAELEAGARYDWREMTIFRYRTDGNATPMLETPEHHFGNLSGNLGVLFRLDSGTRLSFNAGSAWRAPTVNELYSNGLHHGAAAIEYGNPSLKQERTYNGILTLRHERSRILIDVSPFVHYMEGFIYRAPEEVPVATIRGAFPAFRYSQTEALLYGCDLFARGNLSPNIEITGKASLLRARNLTERSWLIMMPPDRYETELIYRFTKRENYLSFSALHVTKQWRVPPASDFAPPPDRYFLFSLHTSWLFHLRSQHIRAGVSINNILNQSYRDYLDRFRYFADARGRNIILRISYEF